MGQMKAYVLSRDDQWGSGADRFDVRTSVGSERHDVLVVENAVRTYNAYDKVGASFAEQMLVEAGCDRADISVAIGHMSRVDRTTDMGMTECLTALEHVLERRFFGHVQ